MGTGLVTEQLVEESTGPDLDGLLELRLPPTTGFSSIRLELQPQESRLKQQVLDAVRDAASSKSVRGSWEIEPLGELPPKLRRLGNYGFRVVDTESIAEGREKDQNVCAVLFVKSAHDRGVLMPVIFPVEVPLEGTGHGKNEAIAIVARNKIYEEFRTVHGYSPEEAVRPSTWACIEKWWDGVKGKFRKLLVPVGIGLTLLSAWQGTGLYLNKRAESELPGLETVSSLALADKSKDQVSSFEMLDAAFTSESGLKSTLRIMHHHPDESVRLRTINALVVFLTRNHEYKIDSWQEQEVSAASQLRAAAMDVAFKDSSPTVRSAALTAAVAGLKADKNPRTSSYRGDEVKETYSALMKRLKDLTSKGKDVAVRTEAWNAYKILSALAEKAESNNYYGGRR